MLTADDSLALRLIAEAVELAAVAGAPRYVAPITDDDTGETMLEITTDEPAGDHVRVSPDGRCVVVYLPNDYLTDP